MYVYGDKMEESMSHRASILFFMFYIRCLMQKNRRSAVSLSPRAAKYDTWAAR